jgi:photosystem II stability/assembly factor-like uncharacterized protein
MSELFDDLLLRRISDVMTGEDLNFSSDLSQSEGQRANAILARVISNLEDDVRPRRLLRGARRTRPPSRRKILVSTAFIVIAVVALGVSVISMGGSVGRLHSPITTSRHLGTILSASPATAARKSHHGTWMLVDDALSGTWQQIAVDPPGEGVTCPTTSACYEMNGNYASAGENSPLLSVSFYASSDVGATWTEFPMPSGFAPTTSLSCGAATDCAAGGTYNGQSVLVSTSNGGQSFTVAPLPSTVGTLFSLSCTPDQFCSGLASQLSPDTGIYHPNSLGDGQPTNATFLSTDDGGSTFTTIAISPGNSLWKLNCTSSLDCIALGDQGSPRSGTTDWAQGVIETTSNGGNTWTAASMPVGFAVGVSSVFSCADALHCSVTGRIIVPFENPPACANNQPQSAPTSIPATAGEPAGKLAAIVKFESSLITKVNLAATPNTSSYGCSWPQETPVSEIMSTTDGGSTWTPEQFPANVPQPELRGLSCPTDNECWASGSDRGTGNSILLGTTNGGATWSKVTFNVPPGMPSFETDNGMGHISCPSAFVCAANAAEVQGAPSAPFYSLVIPSSTT